MACNQNRPAVPHGTNADTCSPGSTPGLTDADRHFFYQIRRARHLNGSPFSIEELVRLRDENVRMQEEAIREFGPKSTTAIWFQKVIAAYDETIADAKSPLGSAINGLRSVLADPTAKEADRKEKVTTTLGVIRQKQLLGSSPDDDPMIAEAMGLIVEVIKRDSDEKIADLEKSVNREKSASGSVPDEEFRSKIITVMGTERQKALLGVNDGGISPKAAQLVVESLNLAADRRVTKLKTLISQEKRSPGSVSDQQFVALIQGVLGDERQKQLMGISESAANSMEPVTAVMKIFIDRRKTAVTNLFQKQKTGDRSVTEQQINQAIADYETVREQARRMGMSVPTASDIPMSDFKIEYKPR